MCKPITTEIECIYYIIIVAFFNIHKTNCSKTQKFVHYGKIERRKEREEEEERRIKL